MEDETKEEVVIDSWLRTTEKRIEDARIKKEKGTALFKDKDYRGAGQCYINALKDIIPILQPSDQTVESTIKELKEALFSNLAACQLKLQQYQRVIENCTKSLDINAQNVKCLYRRASAYLQCRDRGSARKDIDLIYELEPNNTVVRELETKLSSLDMKADQRDAAMMKSFLSSS